MGRLIDADAFERSVMFSDAKDMQDIIYALRDYPPAYNLEKVVEQLKYDTKLYLDKDGEKVVLDEVIEIVKGGGVDEL